MPINYEGWYHRNESDKSSTTFAEGKTIASFTVTEERDDTLVIGFADGSKLELYSPADCCAHRYLHTDDDTAYYIGSIFQDADVSDGPEEPDEYGVHETAFLRITTSKGVLTYVAHNEHNGYYGGIYIIPTFIEAKK